MKTIARFTFDKVRFDQENDVHLVLTLTAPKVDWQAKRAPVCIVPVIDCSSSMSGDKIAYAKKSVLKLLDHLQPGDFAGVVRFSTESSTLAPPAEMTQKRRDELKAKVGDLQSDGWTNFSGGMCDALEHVNKLDLPEGVVIRVIMFTDGQANKGVATSQADIIALAQKARGRATISAFGYGSDASQELLSDLAKACGGNYAFIKDPEDALTAFAKELGGLLSTYAQDIVVELTPQNGHRVTEVVSDVDTDEKGKVVTVRLPEILGEEERNLVFAMKLSEQKQALPRAMSVADVKVTYSLIDDKGKKTTKTEELKAKLSFVKVGDEQKEATSDVDNLVGVAQLVRTQIQAEQHVKRGDFAAAQNAMHGLESNLRSRKLSKHAAAASFGARGMASQQSYSAQEGYYASMKSAGTRGVGSSAMDSQAEVFLADVGVAASNSVQSHFMEDFKGGGGVSVGIGASGGSVAIDPAGGISVSSAGAVKVTTTASKPAPAAPSGVSKKRSDRW